MASSDLELNTCREIVPYVPRISGAPVMVHFRLTIILAQYFFICSLRCINHLNNLCIRFFSFTFFEDTKVLQILLRGLFINSYIFLNIFLPDVLFTIESC